MQKHNIEDVSNDRIINLANILKRDKEILFTINKKDLYLQKSPENEYDLSIFKENTSLDNQTLNFDKSIDGGTLDAETELEAIILSINQAREN